MTALVAAALALAAPSAGAAPSARPGPGISAPAAILVEPSTGDVVYSRGATRRRAIASTTKLMTVLLALERRDLADTITAVPYSGFAAESVAGLRAGERLTVADMVRALLLASANDAAASIAVDVGGSQRGFVALMNRRARRAGLRDTHYANPIGLDAAGNYSTATDLAKLALLVRRDAFARKVMDRPSAVLRSGDRRRVVVNRNTLVAGVPWISGVKTGHTLSAGYVLVGSASRGGVPLVSVVMGAASEAARNADTLALMRYGFARYHRVRALVAGRAVTSVGVKDQGDRSVNVVPTRTVRVVARRGERVAVRARGLPREIEGPVAEGTRVGEAVVRRRGRVVERVPLVTQTAVARATLWARATRALGGPLGVMALLGLAAVAATMLDRERRRRLRRRPGSETA